MYRQAILTVFVLFIGSISGYSDIGKICPRNLIINGTNLITNYRQQILVLGVTHQGCQACRNQAIRYNDLYRDLEYNNIRDPEVRLILVNEPEAVEFLPGIFYGKIRIFQDNYKDRFLDKLGYHGQRLNNLVFGKCGTLIYSQTYPQSNIEDENNYQQLLRVIMSAVKYKQPCYTKCI